MADDLDNLMDAPRYTGKEPVAKRAREDKPRIPAPQIGTPEARAIAEIICERVAEGEVLHDICGPDREDGFPARFSFYRWLDADPELEKMYDRAVQLRVEKYVDETHRIADDGTNDYVARTDPKNPGYDLNGEHVQRSKLRISTRQWYAEKIGRRYIHQMAIGGAENLPPIKTIGSNVPPDEAYRLMLRADSKLEKK